LQNIIGQTNIPIDKPFKHTSHSHRRKGFDATTYYEKKCKESLTLYERIFSDDAPLSE